jgi:hypothetical protein
MGQKKEREGDRWREGGRERQIDREKERQEVKGQGDGEIDMSVRNMVQKKER